MQLNEAIKNKIDTKTKPLGALGLLEEIAFQICRQQNTLSPELLKPHILVFAADHGISEAGVSAYPREVSAQMVLNFVSGGAAINVFSRQHGIALDIIDAGVDFSFDPQLAIRHQKIARGTRNLLHENAISEQELDRCFETSKLLIAEIASKSCNIVGFGEMGIGNTSSAALITHYCLDIPIEKCIGPGTGLNEDGLSHKQNILQRAIKYHGSLNAPHQILCAVGGFEIAMMVQAMISAAENNMLVLVDGFIASAAALLAHRISPTCRDAMIFCHKSAEPGHRYILDALAARAILDMDMRLGEGSACALAYPILESACAFINDMASFESAAVSNNT